MNPLNNAFNAKAELMQNDGEDDDEGARATIHRDTKDRLAQSSCLGRCCGFCINRIVSFSHWYEQKPNRMQLFASIFTIVCVIALMAIMFTDPDSNEHLVNRNSTVTNTTTPSAMVLEMFSSAATLMSRGDVSKSSSGHNNAWNSFR
jgi:hypothetical protein